jgi:hypothetical protein
VVVGAATSCAHLDASTHQQAMRQAAIPRAQVWTKTDVRAMDIRRGPQGKGAFSLNQTVLCDYVDKRLDGASPKFACVIGKDDEVKVKYGRDNGEVYAEVAASRLLWALGFGADRMYPVTVVCRGCPPELRRGAHTRGADTIFEIAAIERKFPGREITGRDGPGWSWAELDDVNAVTGGAPLAERDALKLLAVMIQHTDSKPQQQRLVCLDDRGGKDEDGCRRPFLVINDLGRTFGRANEFNNDQVGSAVLPEWSATPVWRGTDGCVGNLPKSFTGTLENPKISEAGRRFLADLLLQLSRHQIRDLFDVARFPARTRALNDSPGKDPLGAWVAAFEHKVQEIATRRCSAAATE